MIKRGFFKKTAPFVLGIAVASTGIPVTAFAADEFSSGETYEAPFEETGLSGGDLYSADFTEEAVFSDISEEEALFDEGAEESLFLSEPEEAQALSDAKYVYAGISWAEYWANEGVYEAGNASHSEEADGKGEYDKGGFDTVTRATANHGLHRGSYQCTAIIYAEDGSVFQVSHWNSGTEAVLTDNSVITFNRGMITKPDGSAVAMDHYEVTGIKYVPVKVSAEDYEAFCSRYPVVENDAALAGGYSEQQLAAYQKTASVDENTNGLKVAVKNADGSFSFQARKQGSTSGLKDEALKNASDIVVTVKPAGGSYGEFLRVDLTGSGYGALGAAMQTVRWDYYGNGSTVLRSFGTKFAADNWMHKSNGVQLGLTNSVRCQLPKGTDGTGKWVITVYALGYADFSFAINATAENIVKEDPVTSTEALSAAIAQAEALKEDVYTADSWAAMLVELQEAKDELAGLHSQAAVDEATAHLTQAIKDLKEKPVVTISLDVKKATLYVKGNPASVTLKATVSGSEEAVKYTSSDTKVATVSSKGVVKAKKAGTATITAKCGSVKATCKVTVKNPTLTLNKKTATIYTKGTTKVTLTAKKTGVSGTVKYTSSDTMVATVSSKGVVTAKKAGTATITAKCGSVKATCKVTVKKPSLKLSKSSATIKKGGKVTIKATATPKGTIKYKTSNSKVATVTSKGVVKGVKKGTATITVTCNGVSKKFKVTVK